MKTIYKPLFTLSLFVAFALTAFAGQEIVKTMPLDATIGTSGTVRLVMTLTDEAKGPDIGITLHEGLPATPWDDGMAICMFDFTKNTNGGIHLAGYNSGTWDWHDHIKKVEKGRQIALWLTVNTTNNTHALYAQMQGESDVTEVYTNYGDRASIKGKANSSVGYCSVFVNNKEGQTRSAVQIVEEAVIVDSIEPYEFTDTTCFTSYGDPILATITSDSSYQFAGQDINTTGMYYDTLMNVGGCDSIITLNLTVISNSDKEVILQQMQKVNTYYMTNNPETAQVNSGEPNWLEGSYYTGHVALFKLHPTAENMSYAMQWGENVNWEIGNRPHEADNQCVGQVYMDLYYANGAKDDDMLAKVGKSVSDMVNRGSSSTADWDWVDALYMAMPTLTRYGLWTGNDDYFDKLYEMYHSTKVSQELYNANDSLWYRDGKVLSGNKYKCYWSRGNGWVFGAHVRTLKYLPEDDAHRQEYIDTYKAMAKKLKSVQRADGFWNATLDDATYYPGKETSGTGFFVYGMAWGINNGYLDKDTYLPTVMKGWNALVEHALDTDGRIGYVQGVADEPKDDQPVTFAKSREYGYGNFLLAGTEVIHLVEGTLPIPELFYTKSVEALDDEKLRVHFFEPADKNSAEQTSNYSVNKGITVEEAVLSPDGMSCELQLSGLAKGGYGISFTNIESVSGKTIEAASGQYFYSNTSEISTLDDVIEKRNDIKLYPNPTNQNFVMVEMSPKSKGKVELSLMDTSGKVLLTETTRSRNYQLNIKDIASGIYILNARGEEFNVNKKLVIN